MKRFFRYLLKTVGVLALVLFVALAFLHWYQPDVQPVVLPAQKPVSGAAVFYNQAFTAMPKLSDAEKKLFDTKEKLDVEAAKQLVAKCDASLRLIAQGAAQTECEWGLDYSLGPRVKVSPLVKSIELCNLLKTRTRIHLLNGEIPAATDDLLLIVRIARHVGQPPVLIPKLVEISENVIAATTILRHLQEFDPASLQRLHAAIAPSPLSTSLSEAVAMETKGFLANMRGRKVGGELMTLGTDMPDPLSKLMLRLTDEVPLLSSAMLAHVERDSRELEALVRVPYPDGRRKIDEFVEKLDIEKMGLMRKHLNIWSSLLLPSEARVRHKQVQSEAMWAILRTAIDAQIKNPAEVRAQLAKLRDPYDGNPIAMRDVEGGVEITLKSNEGRTPVTITVGLGGK